MDSSIYYKDYRARMILFGAPGNMLSKILLHKAVNSHILHIEMDELVKMLNAWAGIVVMYSTQWCHMASFPAASEPRLGLGNKVIVFLIVCDKRGMLKTLADKKCKSAVASEVREM